MTMAPVRERRIIDDNGADAAVQAATTYASERGHRVVVAVVDPSGELVELRRTAGAQIASSRVAIDKARTAAIFVRPSRELEEQVSGGRLGALALHGAAALTGGIPLVVDGEVVGAIGTSGETPDEDEAISKAGASAALSTKAARALTFDGARVCAEAAGAVAAGRGVSPVIAVVDAGGELVYLHRPDAAQVASVGVATDKARTAAIYRRPSKDFEEQASNGRASALHLARAVPLQGGVPIMSEGEVVGAIGVSGASSADEDQELAELGAAALGTIEKRATHFSAAEVAAKFETGGLLLETSRYAIDAGRREAPGAVECHEHTVDVMHAVDGTATVVAGGETFQLGAGDVLVIPAGVDHEFTAVSDPFLYFVVKVET
jgi:glc operon protein GlcG